MMLQRQRRSGATIVEGAIVYPVLFLLVLGIIMVALGVFRYQQVAHAAREGARWAAVHGARYADETGQVAATPELVYENAIKPQMAGTDPGNITYSVSWDQDNRQSRSYISTSSTTGETTVAARANTVTVTVRYSWNTGIFGVIPVSSTTSMTMAY